jgi:small subunit ribosomal protein S21
VSPHPVHSILHPGGAELALAHRQLRRRRDRGIVPDLPQHLGGSGQGHGAAREAQRRRSLGPVAELALDLALADALMSRVDVIDNQVDAALKQLKKLMLKEGAFQEMKRRAHYEKPSVKRKRKAAAARKKRRRAQARIRVWDNE